MRNALIKTGVYILGVSVALLWNGVSFVLAEDMSVGTSNLKILGSDRENADLGEFDEMEEIKRQGRSRIEEKAKREAQNKKGKKDLKTTPEPKNKKVVDKSKNNKDTGKKNSSKKIDKESDNGVELDNLDGYDDLQQSPESSEEELEFYPTEDVDIDGSGQNDDLITNEDIDVGFEDDKGTEPGPDYGKMYNDRFEKERSKGGVIMDDSFYETPPPEPEDDLLNTDEYESSFGSGF